MFFNWKNCVLLGFRTVMIFCLFMASDCYRLMSNFKYFTNFLIGLLLLVFDIFTNFL